MTKLLKYAKGKLIFVILTPLMVICEVMLEVRIPFLLANIVDIGIKNSDLDYVYRTGGMMIVMALLSLVFGALAARFASVAGVGFACNVRESLFGKTQDFSFSNIDKFSTASIVTRLTTDINTIQNAFMMSIRILFRAPIMFVMAIIYAIRINARLSLVFFVIAPILVAFLAVFASIAFPRFRKLMSRVDKINSVIQQNLISIRVVKAYVRARHEKDKFKLSNDELRDSAVFAEKVLILAFPIMMAAMFSCVISVMWFGGNLVIDGLMLTGELISFITYITQILMSLMMVSMIFVMLTMSRASVGRVIELLEEDPDINDDEADRDLVVENGEIEFKKVCFKYKKDAAKNVLEDINLKIKSGETIGIIGGTGSAKTTLVQLIPRLYDINSGELYVGGHSVKDYTIEHLRAGVSMVLQKNVLFSGTIIENLRWGNPEATQEEIVQVCKVAQAHDFINSFPDGYQTDLGQGGVNISGGQKQRLCIARALLKKPKILILDDSTSAIDTETDAKIREGFKNLIADTTTIIIAQRIKSIETADRIIVLDDGKINDIGTHEELLARNKIYSEVYYSQQEGSVA